MKTKPNDWREITVEDMGRILLARIPEGSNLYTKWEEFREGIYEKDGTEYKYPYRWLTYFVTVCALTYETNRHRGAKLEECDLEKLKKDYDLIDATCKAKPDWYPSYLRRFKQNSTCEKDGFEEMKKFVQGLGDTELKLDHILDQLIKFKKDDYPETIDEVQKRLENYFEKGNLLNIWKIWKEMKKEELEKSGAGEVLEHLESGGAKQIILNGAPGTGKSYISELLAEYLGSRLPGEENFYTRVQFHPSYDYTDFVEGLRPVEGENGGMIYKKLDGHFKSFCRRVVKEGNPDKKYFFLIDEINRADLSKVFGELMFCLESDKRGEKVRTQYQNLPTYDPETKNKDKDVFAGGFFIPENVYIIGTMNDIDRSVESMDFALRRRFLFKEIKVDEALLENAFRRIFEKLADEQRGKLVNSVVALNKKIEAEGKNYNLNRQYFISQGQFANLPEGRTGDLEQIKKTVWEYRIEPLLREYLRGESEDDIKKFVKDCGNAFGVEVEDSAS